MFIGDAATGCNITIINIAGNLVVSDDINGIKILVTTVNGFPEINRSIDGILARNGRLSEADLDEIRRQHLLAIVLLYPPGGQPQRSQAKALCADSFDPTISLEPK